jgi:hypothetical protein
MDEVGTSALPPISDFDLFGNCQGVDLDTEAADRALDLCMAEEQLHGPEIPSLSANQRRFCSAQGDMTAPHRSFAN